MPKKSCGGCFHFTKWKNDKYGCGLCELHDYRVQTSKSACSDHQRPPYSRLKNKKETAKIIMEHKRGE